MTEITLVRHGQASFGTDDYDRLSPLGHQQAQWLGEYYAARGQTFDRILIGSQRRHRETAEGILSAYQQRPELEGHRELEIHPGLNEYDFHSLYESFCRQYPEQTVTSFEDRRHFYAILQRALLAWSQQELDESIPETWQDFSTRVESAMTHIAQLTQPDSAKLKVLVVSSGGAISMILKQALNLSPEHMISLNLQVINSAFSKLMISPARTHLLSFNNIPHLDLVDRMDSITYS